MIELKLQIPEDFWGGETRCGYYITPEMKKIWAVELDLLAEFMRVCKEHSLPFWADGGTLLGAVRHKGMIPWDDDIDLTMMRSDFEKLCKIAPKVFRQPYFFQTEETDPGTRRGHAQLRNSLTTGILKSEYKPHVFRKSFNQGIFIDVFPLDGIPDDDIICKGYFNELTRKRRKSDYIYKYTVGYCPADSLLQKLRRSLIHYFMTHVAHASYIDSYNAWQQMLTTSSYTKTERLGKLCFCPMEENRIWYREDFKSSEYAKFEMLEIPIPIGFERILTTFYGDWKKYIIGNSSHGGVIFDTEQSYIDFFKKADLE